MAELLTSLVSPIMEKLGELIFEKVKRQFIYLCCFNSNIESLREEVQNLKNETDDLQSRVDAANRNTDVTSSVVQDWITHSNKIQDDMNGIEDEIKNVKSGCLAIKSHYLLSRKARETADAIGILRGKGNFKPEEISVPALPQATAPIPQGLSEEFDSRKQIEEEIMEDLRGGKVHMMGICGMGGVGKTTMAEKIMNRVSEEKLFEEVAKIVISQEVRKLEIQGEIAEKFGMEKLKEDTLSARAHKVRLRLTDKKRKLLILDDIWKKLDMKSLGIPCKSDEGEGCTILITSRSREVLSDMNAKPFGVQILTPKEALSLFRGKIGTCMEPEQVVKEVVNECKGLPLALVTIGAALKDKSTEHWNVALRKLRSSNPNIPKVLKEVYEPIKVSYDFLDNPDARSLFLLCCLFPEDCDIDLEYLTIHGVGLRMFTGDEITTLEEARDSVRVLIDTLRSCFLLLDGRCQNHVKMHDVVRDVAIFIASEEGRIVRNLSLTASRSDESINCEWISMVGKEINNFPFSSSFPSLRLLKIEKYPADVEDCSFFKGMIELNVLFFRSISFSPSPETAQALKKLRTLHLEECDLMGKISFVGEFLNLEVLICRSCSRMTELPVEIGRLKQLRMLEVNSCYSLRIAPGVISNLVQLEELIIIQSFNNWEAKAANGEQRKNAALCEIEHLKNLTRLEIEINNVNLATEEICFPSNIVKFAVKVGSCAFQFDGVPYERKMHLLCKGDITFGKWIHMFLTSTEYLHAEGESANNLDISQAQKMKRLILEDSSKVNKLVNLAPSVDWSVGVFPLLDSLKLFHLPNLEEICVGPIPKSSNSFGNLKEIDLSKCIKLRKLFPLFIAKDDLLQLETLEIYGCEMMEHVFHEIDRKERHKITFPNLKSLGLLSLSRLISFSEGSESIEFPLLETIFISGCRKLKSLISSAWDGHHDVSFREFFNQKVIFGNLMEINIWGCDGIRILFSSSIAENLVKLKKLWIQDCTEMVKVIENDEDVLCKKSRILFPCLKELHFKRLPKLLIFCNWRCELELPSLGSVEIKSCPLLEFFTIKFVLFRSLRLKKIVINDCNDNTGHLSSSSIAKNLVNLDELRIINCKEMVKMIVEDEEILHEKPHQLFRCLKKLYFADLPKLQSFGDGRCEFELPSLESIEIKNCPLLEFFTMESVVCRKLQKIGIDGCNYIRCVFSFSVVKNLVNLEELNITSCMKMVKVIEDNNDMLCEKPRTLFPNLKMLYLADLPELQSFGNRRCDDLPSLKSIEIWNCLLLKFFTTESVGFRSLKEINIYGCNNIRSLFLSSVAINLVNLKELIIRDCAEIVKVIEDDDDMLCENPPPLFPCLEELCLWGLSKLESFSNWKCDLQLCSLEKLLIRSCPSFAFFTMGNVTTANLRSFQLDWYSPSLEDLNTAIEQHDFYANSENIAAEETNEEIEGFDQDNFNEDIFGLRALMYEK